MYIHCFMYDIGVGMGTGVVLLCDMEWLVVVLCD